MNPKVSIIIAAYNLGIYIKEAVDSLLQQKVDFQYEIILIDDASTDNTWEILEEYKSETLKIYRNSINLGANQSIQNGFSIAKGEYVCRFDPDDKWKPDFLKTCASTLDLISEVDLVYTDIQTIDSNGAITSPANHNIGRPNFKEGVLENEFYHILKNYYICAPGIMARKTAWNLALPLPNELKAIDWYMSCCMLQKGQAYFINKQLAYYRVHKGNMHTYVVLDNHDEYVRNFILSKFVINNKSFSFFQKNNLLSYNFFMQAEKYFGVGYWKDAKRNYIKTLSHPSGRWFNISFWRHLFATFVPAFYNSLKVAK